MSDRPYDVAIVGGGLVGLATALALLERAPALAVALCEKEPRLAAHQSSHNSGVIHAGIYYAPGSAKARLCVEGARLLTAFCDRHGIRYERRGKVIVATRPEELPRLERLYERGLANGVPGLARLDAARLREIEPHAAGLAAIHSPATAVVDFAEVAAAIGRELERRGATILTGAPVTRVRRTAEGYRLGTPRGEVAARLLINCAGLYADRVARLCGVRPPVAIVPFRGEYYRLRPERRELVRGLIYPVPDPALPFLGVHFTRGVTGEVEAGPNAVLALAREGYSYRDVRPAEVAAMLAYRGFWRMAARYWRAGLAELYRSLVKRAFARALARLVPEVREADLLPGGAGVRAQAVAPDGRLVDDFRIVETDRAIHVLNAPSP
ncbi:MAG TPA: L-2-hydroxyglutarate oxidase, partial [Thermodesulfobacteriota bacterium]|nr:L-2-hydroxyglutarate oxidase [Thermodesulfobacteriota bacterium]